MEHGGCPVSMPEVPGFDTGNALLGETPAQLSTTVVETTGGQRLALTIRTPSTTLTVLLNGKDAGTWSQNISRAAGAMSKSGLIVANGHVPAGGGQPS